MFTDKVMGGTAVLLSYAVFLAMLPAFDLGKAHGKTPKNNKVGFNRSSSLNTASLSHRSASHPLT